LTNLGEDRMSSGPNALNGYEMDGMKAGSRFFLHCRMNIIVGLSKSLGLPGPITIVMRTVPTEVLF
jgi:hypothetical protein